MESFGWFDLFRRGPHDPWTIVKLDLACLAMQSVGAVPLAVLLQFDPLTIVVLVFVRDVVATPTHGALERYVDALIVFRHQGLSFENRRAK